MTPEHLAELEAAWPGMWAPAEHPWHADVRRRRAFGDADWSIFAFAYSADHYLEARSQDRDDLTLTGRGRSFAEAKASLLSSIVASTEQLRLLQGMVP